MESIDESDICVDVYEQDKAMLAMQECERHVDFAGQNISG